MDIGDLFPINESFDAPLRLQWKTEHVDGGVFVLARFRIDDGDFVVRFKRVYYNPGICEISFTRNNTLDLTGTGSAALVISTVLSAIRQFVLEHRPRVIEIIAKRSERSRIKLYPKLISMLVREFPAYKKLEPKETRTWMTYTLERPADPYVPPAPVDKEPYRQVSPEEFAEIEELLNQLRT